VKKIKYKKKVKVLLIFGTRPEAIKLAPIIYELKKNKKYFDTKICVSGQHREMLDQVLSFFKIYPDYDLNIMKAKQDLFQITGSLLNKIKSVILSFNSDLIIVHGDTTTSLSAALAAYYCKIKIVHIEAGLRTNDIYSPWPEEGNRKLISAISNINFSPTKHNYENLIKEGVKKSTIFITGNTVIDSVKIILERIKNNKLLKYKIEQSIKKNGFKFIDSKFILVTLHRRENFGEGIINVCKALKKLSENYKDIYILFPVHLNPQIALPVSKLLSTASNIILVKPIQYAEFLYLMNKSFLIISDSGGIQEESQIIGKPVLITRTKTERPEGLKSGNLKLIGTNTNNLIKEVSRLIDDQNQYNVLSKKSDIYGDGTSSKKIINILKRLI